MDGDGDLDVIVPAHSSGQVEIYWNDGAGVLDPVPAVISTSSPIVPMPIDRDQDGDLDLLVTANPGNGCLEWINDGAGGFSVGANYETRAHGIDIGDIDLDGLDDAVWTMENNLSGLRPVSSIPGGGFTAHPSFGTHPNTHFVRIVDLNADGAPDLVSSSTASNGIRTMIGDGAGGFAPNADHPTGADPIQIELADLDNDGDQDIIVAVGNDNYIRLYENNGSSAGIDLIHQGDFPMGAYPRDVKIHDFNGDGFLDMAAACWNSNDLRIRYGVGPFDFSGPEVIFQNHTQANDLATGDLNGDGLIDLVTTSYGANKITIHLNHFSHDCNGNGILDSDDITNGTSLDCNLNGIPDECEEDCNQNGILDSCDIASGFALDCNQNGVPDWCDINNDPSLDVNLNSIPDSCEGPGRTWILSPVTGNWYAVTDPLSADLAEFQASNWGGHLVTVNDQAENDWLANQFGDATHPFWIGLTDVAQEGVYQWINGEPVGYLNWRAGEPDDAPGVFGADFTILYPPTADWLDEPQVPPTWPLPRGVVELVSSDCDGNGLPDVWELIADPSLDCDDNGVHDFCDLQDPSLDCDGDGVLDSCQIDMDPSLDCDGNGSIDSCEILADPSLDCDGVQGLDSCQIELDPSLDWDGNDVLDSCAGGGPTYCFGNINAAGNVGSIEASGSPLIADNNLTISSHGLPIGQPGYYLFSANSAYVNPFGGGAGVLCLGAPIRRLNHLAGYPVLFVNAAGDVSLTLDLGNLPATILVPGDVYIFQLWHREFDPVGSPTSNTTDSMRVMFR